MKILRLAEREGMVHGFGDALILLVHNERSRMTLLRQPFLDERYRIIGTGVVDDVKVCRRPGLRQNTVEGLTQETALIVTEGDHGYQWITSGGKCFGVHSPLDFKMIDAVNHVVNFLIAVAGTDGETQFFPVQLLGKIGRASCRERV